MSHNEPSNDRTMSPAMTCSAKRVESGFYLDPAIICGLDVVLCCDHLHLRGMATTLLSEADIQEWLDEKSPADLVSALYQLEPPAWADELCTPAAPIATPAPDMFTECMQRPHIHAWPKTATAVPPKSAHPSSGGRRCAQTHCHRSGREMSSNATRSCSRSGSSTWDQSRTRISFPELRRGASLCCASWPQGNPLVTSSRRSGASAPPSGPVDIGATTCRRGSRRTKSPSWSSSASTEIIACAHITLRRGMLHAAAEGKPHREHTEGGEGGRWGGCGKGEG